jgi:hypothetical protein
VLFQLLLLLGLLVFIGEPLRAVALKRLDMFSDLDLVQICVLDVFVGGFILYVLAILPLELFSLPIVTSLTLFCMVISIFIHRKSLRNLIKMPKKEFFSKHQARLLGYLLVFLMFLVFISINLSAVSSLEFGSVRDESIHSLYVQVISENHYIPLTLQPYLPEAIIYPQASHVIFTYAYYVTGLNVPQVIMYVSILFKSLSIFGAYFLGRKLGKSTAYALGLSFIFAFISSWPLNVTWGANPFIVGFPLFLICLGLLFSLYRKPTLIELIVLGLLVGYNGALILSYFETFILVASFFLVYILIKKRNSILHVPKRFGTVLIASLIPLSPFFYRFIAFYGYPNHNIGLPADITSLADKQHNIFSQSLQWGLNNLSPYFLLKALILLFVAAFLILLFVTNEYRNTEDNIVIINWFAIAIFVSAVILSLVSFFLTPDVDVISWGHQGILLSIPLSIVTLNFFIKLKDAISEGKFTALTKIIPKGSSSAMLLAIIVLSLLTAPFMYYRLTTDSENLRNAYNVYAVTAQSDYDLMNWMSANLSSSAVILVHPYEAGLFIPSVSHQKIIFPYTASCMSSSYQTLVHLIANNTLNAATYKLMQNWNITYVYLGANVAYLNNEFPWWNPQLFIGNPNFKLTKNFTDSYLFKLDIADPNVSFFDDFEHLNWDQNGWKWDQAGYGFGNVSITKDSGGSRELTMTARAAPTVQTWEPKYIYFVEGPLFSLNSTDVTLSFYLNATEGFSGKDTFAVLVSNLAQSQAVVFLTSNGIFQNYSSTTKISGNQGLFSFDLSKIWQQTYNSSLPQTAVLQFVNYDFDGTQNVVHLDNITVTATPSAALIP